MMYNFEAKYHWLAFLITQVEIFNSEHLIYTTILHTTKINNSQLLAMFQTIP